MEQTCALLDHLQDKLEPNFKDFTVSTKSLKFMWLGCAGLLLQIDGKNLLLDPNLSEVALNIALDAVIITHLDKLDEETVFLLKDVDFIVSNDVAEVLRNWGIRETKIKELGANETHFSNELKILRGPFSSKKNPCDSLIIEGIKEKIFYSSGTAFIENFRKIGDEFGPFDLTFIDNEVQLPEETLQGHLDLNGTVLVPTNFSVMDFSNQALQRMASAWEIPVIVPKLGHLVQGIEIL